MVVLTFPRRLRQKDRVLLEADKDVTGAAQARHQARPQTASSGTSSIPARPNSTMAWRRHGPSRWRPTRRTRRARPSCPGSTASSLALGGKDWSQSFTLVKNPVPRHDHPGLRRAVRPAHGTDRVALEAEGDCEPAAPDEAPLEEAVGRAGKAQRALKTRALAIVQKLSSIERVLVDPQRKSARDVLRNPAGLNDTLFDMVSMTTIADAAPTTQTQAVSREILDKVENEIARFDALVTGEVAALNTALAKARVGYVT